MSNDPKNLMNGGDTAKDGDTRFDPKAVVAVKIAVLLLALGLVLVLLVANASRGIGVLSALAVTAAGGALGFLFGIPRSAADPAAAAGTPAAARTSNASLEQVADWLTKILLGAGLTQLAELKRILLSLSNWISACVNFPADGWFACPPANLARVFGLGVVGYFSVMGFLAGYLATRLLLARLLTLEDKTLLDLQRAAKAEGEKIGRETVVTEQKLNKEKVEEQLTKADAAGDKKLVEQAEGWEPPRKPTKGDDPQKGRFGGKLQDANRQLSATVTPVSGQAGEVFDIVLRVESTDPGKVLKEPVKFFVHDTFEPDTFVVVPENGVAVLELVGWGAFTTGAITDGGKTLLELDLALLQDAPAKFRSR